jgi:hypothetical protein
MIPEFLPANPMESARVYALRQKSAFYRSYVGPVIDFFSAQLFAAPFVVRATVGSTTDAFIDDGFYAAFKEDCDGAGTDLSQFMKTRFTEALVKGRSWILAELPEDGGRPASSAAEWTERGLGRATLCKLSPDEVLDWEVGEDGEMEWAITYSCAYKRPDPRASRTLKTERWRLYDRTTVQTYEVTFDPKRTKITSSTDVPLKSERPHGFPRILPPLAPVHKRLIAHPRQLDRLHLRRAVADCTNQRRNDFLANLAPAAQLLPRDRGRGWWWRRLLRWLAFARAGLPLLRWRRPLLRRFALRHDREPQPVKLSIALTVVLLDIMAEDEFPHIVPS